MANRSRTPLSRLHLADLGPQDHIAHDFRVYELCRSELAQRLDIGNNLPDDATLRAAAHLTRAVMQPIRDHYARPFSPISVYRCQDLERVLKGHPPGWVSTSPHILGCACDLRIPGIDTLALARWAAEHLPDYDEVLVERFDPRQGPSSGWVHIAVGAPAPRRGRPAGLRQQRSQIRDARSGRWVLIQDRLTDSLP